MTATVIAMVPVVAVVGGGVWFQAWACRPTQVRGRNVAPVSKEGTPCP